VFAYAKRDLRKGDTLDGIGGYTCYGLIENCPSEVLPSGLPIALADDVGVKRDVGRDERILLSDVDYNAGRFDFDLYLKALRSPKSFLS
jgi:predicted homoserine dehydrogenase-like protein